jgi:hypothetical protein
MGYAPNQGILPSARAFAVEAKTEKHKAIGFTGSMLDPERRGKNIMAHPPVTNWISEFGFVGWCAACGAAKHERERPVGDAQCGDCRADMIPEQFRHYISPSAFRTDFRPEDGDLDEAGVMSTRIVATVAREDNPQDVGSIRTAFRTKRGGSRKVLNSQMDIWRARRDSNSRPSESKSDALSS